MSTPRETIEMAGAGDVVRALATTIVENRDYLSEIDGLIGDGDHGVNMGKGFALAARALGEDPVDLAPALRVLGNTLLGQIGGSMGPLYGSFFLDMADAIDGRETLDAEAFESMLATGIESVQSIGGAKPGDKTLIDTLTGAHEAFIAARRDGAGFGGALAALAQGAERGKEATRDMVARIGRASRLGERSRGVLDAGAVSSFLILRTLAESLAGRLQANQEGAAP